MSEVVKIRVEINTKTSKWRFYDVQLGVYSSEEFDKKMQAFKAADKYRKRHYLLKPKKKEKVRK
jgi:hypothetical protein